MVKTIKKEGYNLHIIKTTKFKTISMKILIWNELKKEELSFRNMLADNLLFSCKKYNDNIKMSIKKQELYNTSIYSATYRNGTQITTEISFSCIEDKYTEKGNFSQSLDFLFECLNNPNVKNNMFDEKTFNIAKERLTAAINNEQSSPWNYCYQKFKQIIGNNMFSGSILGSLKDLDKVTPKSLYDYYKKFFLQNHVDIYIVGNVNEHFIEDYLDTKIKLQKNNITYTKPNNTYKKEYTENVEKSHFNQSRLLLGSSTKNLTDHERKYESVIYSILLGNSPNSKLFQNVREKNSYAYSISSNMIKLDGLFIISAGISYKNYLNTKKEIQKAFKEMEEGKFSLKDIKNAKESIKAMLTEINDSPWSMIDHYNNYLYYGADTIEKQLKEINDIKKEDIINIAKKIKIDTIYLLKEDENEKI